MKAYTFLLFDADNTLLDFSKGAEIAFRLAMKEIGYDTDHSDYLAYAVENEALWKAYERREITKERIYTDRFVRYAAKSGRALPVKKLDSLYRAYLAEQSILIEGAEELLRDLKEAGYRLSLITNGDTKVQTARIAQSPIRLYLDDIFISEAIGHAKPSPLFFDAVEKAIAGFDRSRALVIGDSETSDIQGANNAGIDCCYVRYDKRTLPATLHADYCVDNLCELRSILL